MPFGVHGAPATFQMMMDKLTSDLEESAAAYLDDQVILSNSWEEHLQHIRKVFHQLRAARLTANPKSASLQCTHLGHVAMYTFRPCCWKRDGQTRNF